MAKQFCGGSMADPNDAVEFLRLVNEADNDRVDQQEDLRFRFGDQWPLQIQNSRMLEARPALTINETDAFLRKVENQQRQQRPRMNPHPVGSQASIEVAKVLKGLCRHIEVNSDADNAYDLAFSFAVTMGKGYFRMRTDYVREDSMDQDIYIDQVENPFSVYFDPNSTLPDGSDAERALISDLIPKAEFRRQYPGAEEQNFSERGSGDATQEWIQKETIRVAEYMYVDKVRSKLVKLSNGMVAFEDKIPKPELLAALGLTVIGDRPSWKRSVKWQKQTNTQILAERTLPGRWIPVIPVYGVRIFIDNKRRTFGLVRFAKDPQTMLNFWQTSMTEIAALAPKAKWMLAEGQQEGHENEFARANVSALPYLVYKPTTVDGQIVPAPERQQPEGIPAASMQNAMMMGENLKRVLGVFDPQVKTDGNKSGKAIQGEKMQSEESNFNYYDNLTRSLKHAARIILDWTPTIYDTQRVMRIIGDDGKPDLVTLNERKEVEGATKILNDVTVGEYDVVMDTGPGYNTKRQEALEVFTAMLGTPLGEKIAQTADDLLVRQMDVPGAEAIADRLAAANPLAQIDEKSEIPAAVQMKMKGMQHMIQQLQQQLQQAGIMLKSRQDVEEIKSHTTLLRERMVQQGEAQDREITRASKAHDTETFALTAQNVAEINGLVKLLTSKTEHGHRLREMLMQFEHESAMTDKTLKAKADQTEPTVQ
jgi:hypothetical protein